MFGSRASPTWHFRRLVTRLGEAQLVLPLALFAATMQARMPQARPGALRWITLLGTAVFVTTATKVAFIGWGIGSAALDFTGTSGHTMFAAAVYAPLFAATASGKWERRCAVGLGCVLALLVGISRVLLATHSVSEIMAGWLVGGLVSVGTIPSAVAVPGRRRAADAEPQDTTW